jgi:serine protease Do
MYKINLPDFFKKNNFWSIFIACFLISAITGAFFGYYGVSILGSSSALPSFIKLTPKKSEKIIDEQTRVIDMVNKSSPAVVSIIATKDLTIVEQGGYNPFQNFCDDPFFKQFLGDQCNKTPQQPKSTTQKQQVAAGTGFLISSDGLILTNKHVVDISGAEFTAITNLGKKYSAKLLAKDPIQDIALLRISGSSFPTLPLADSTKIQIGQTVVAIGNALGQFSNTVSKGVISGLSRSITAGDSTGSSEKLDQVIQTDAAINPGNSGGPLLNLDGEVIGINTAIAEGAQNIGFAIPINQAKKDVDQIKKTGKISYAFLGIRYLIIDDTVKQKNNLSVNYGALIVRGDTQSDVAVMPGSPADKAGLKENDIILEVNGKKINASNDLAKLMQTFNVGDTINLKILSQGNEKTIPVILTERSQ